MDLDQAVARLSDDPGRTAIFTDFDGTLAPIVDRPEGAAALPGARNALESLAARYCLTAIVSGRSLRDLRARIDPVGVVLAGSYGRERSDISDARPRTGGWETVAVAAASRTKDMDGVVIERKGAGLAIHYRLGPSHHDEVLRITAELAREFDLQVRPGRLVAELVVPGPGKADAVADLLGDYGAGRWCYAGDDIADVEVFEWARSEEADCVLIAVASAEAPAQIAELADLVLSGPQDVLAMFDRLAAGP